MENVFNAFGTDAELKAFNRHNRKKRVKIILAIIVLTIAVILNCSLDSEAQVTIGATVGPGYKKGYSLVASLDAGYSFPTGFYVGYNMRANADRHNPADFGVIAGHQITINDDWMVMPYTGYYRRMVSTDNKSLNFWEPGGGFHIIHKNLNFDVAYVERFQIGIGVMGAIFRRH